MCVPGDGCRSPPSVCGRQCETARLDGGVYHRIDENRQRAERLERAAMDDPPPPLGAAAVTIETFIKYEPPLADGGIWDLQG